MDKKRLQMVRQTETFDEDDNPNLKSYSIRNLHPQDGHSLGELIYAAYRETVDDEGQSLVDSIIEADETLSGKYGNVIWDASFVTIHDASAVSATVVTDYVKTGPLLAFALTRPEHQNRGLARYLVKLTLSALDKLGVPQLRLVVTEQNHPALSLYRKLGFATESESLAAPPDTRS